MHLQNDGNFNQTLWQNNPEDNHLCTHYHENVKSFWVAKTKLLKKKHVALVTLRFACI
jgi:hypothetical protein